jgi:hypothetical protein
MTKAPENTGSTASRPDTWLVLARNLIPVVGIYGFG